MKIRLRNIISVNYIFLILMFFFSCRTVSPTGPAESYNFTAESYPRLTSSINIPVEVSLTGLENKINNEIKGLIFEDNTLDSDKNEKHHIKVWKKENISLESFDENILIKAPLKVWAKGALNLDKMGIDLGEASKEIDFEVNVLFRTRVNINEDWEISTETLPAGMEWVKKPSIKLGFLNIPIAGVLEPVIHARQKELADELDSRIAKDLHIKNYVKEAWVKLQNPLLLNKELNAWLSIAPQEIILKPFNGSGKTMAALVSLNGFTETSVGQKPEKSLAYHLPKLKIDSKAEFTDRFEILVNSEIDQHYAERIARQQLLNKTFTYKNGKKKITIIGLELYGSNDKIVVKANVEGNINGTLFLTGVPYYNEADQSISLDNLDFDINTRNKLHRTASWLLHGKLSNELEKVIRIPIGKQLNEAKEIISSHITKKELAKGITLEGNLEDIRPVEFYITSGSYVAVVKATGTAIVRGVKL